MRSFNFRWAFLAGCVLLISIMVGIAWASSAALHTLEWKVLGIGGEAISSGNLNMKSTLGQSVIGASSGGNVTLGAGFWYGGGRYEIYLPILLKNY